MVLAHIGVEKRASPFDENFAQQSGLGIGRRFTIDGRDPCDDIDWERRDARLTDAIADLLGEPPVFAFAFAGDRYDCGNKLGYLQATVAYGLAHEGVGDSFREYLREISKDL